MGKRIIIVGLPLFAKRLSQDLKSFDPSLKVTALDTYYNKKDKIKALFLIPFCSVVYSINGTTSKSRVFDLAFFFKKKVMMTWVGTDVTKAIKNQNRIQKYIDRAEHYCEVQWIQTELKETLDIDAEILNFFNFNNSKSTDFPALNKGLNVLSYIAKNREEYYGLPTILELAKNFPNVKFDVVGTDGKDLEQAPNLTYHGWVEDMQPLFEKAHVTVRLIEHDGLSGFVLESLFNKKYVLYSNSLEGVLHVENKQDAVTALGDLNKQLQEQSLTANEAGAKYIKNHFMHQQIMANLRAKMISR